MKRVIILTVLFFFVLSKPGVSQNYISKDKIWSLVFEIGFEYPFYETKYYSFSGEKMIDGISYSILNEANDEFKQDWLPDSYWREQNDSVFVKYTLDENPKLLYDFNMEVGDSIIQEYHFYIHVDSIKYLEWGGEIRKHLYFSGEESGQMTTWIEGVGNIEYFKINSNIGRGGSKISILCFEENGELIYQNPEFSTCYISTKPVSKEELSESEIEIRPYCFGSLIVYNYNQLEGELVLFTLDGKQLSKTKINQAETEICLPQTGIIIYQFTKHTGEVQTGKVIAK